MLAFGAAKSLSIPSTPEDTLRELLGDILDAEREQRCGHTGASRSCTRPRGSGRSRCLCAPAAGFDAVFVRGPRAAGARARPPRARRASAPAVTYAPQGPPVPQRAAPATGRTTCPARPSPSSCPPPSPFARATSTSPTASPRGSRGRRAPRLGDERIDCCPRSRCRPRARSASRAASRSISASRCRGSAAYECTSSSTRGARRGGAPAARAPPPSLASLHMPVPLEDLADFRRAWCSSAGRPARASRPRSRRWHRRRCGEARSC